MTYKEPGTNFRVEPRPERFRKGDLVARLGNPVWRSTGPRGPKWLRP